MRGWKVVAAAAILGVCAAISPVSAQSLSIDDPDFVSLGAGGFDFDHDKQAVEFLAEYRFGYKILGVLKPFLGGFVTSDSALYGYGGFGVDIYFGNRVVLTPNAAVGAFTRGNGKNLGSNVEFRTGAELAYRFDDRSRLGLALHHISNAGITKQNPGTETLMLIYSIPLTLLK
jgi:lipid A 3-O-deacylase